MKPLVTRTPRRIQLDHPSLAKLDVPTSPPPANSITSQLWEACYSLAQDALNSPYIQGIANGTLPPCNYGQYTVQDAAYCVRAEQDYRLVEARAKKHHEDVLAAFAQARYESYLSYTDSIMKAWHIKDILAINSNDAVKAYVAHEHYVAEFMEPIYGVVAMIPCDRLWSWLAETLSPDNVPNNLYDFWISDNQGWSGTYRLENFVNSWFAAHPKQYEWESALKAYRGSMLGEVGDFRAALE